MDKSQKISRYAMSVSLLIYCAMKSVVWEMSRVPADRYCGLYPEVVVVELLRQWLALVKCFAVFLLTVFDVLVLFADWI